VTGLRSAIIFLLPALLLTACGGGGSSGTPTPEPTTPVNLAPEAVFTATPETGEAPLEVAFDASASRDPDGRPVGSRWDFGDGASGEGLTTSHVYDRAGDFRARLTVTDDDGASDAAVATISVSASGFTVSGTLRVQTANLVDSDTNDPAAASTSNDDFDRAQAVPNPATIGGYVAAAGAGEPGAVFATGDTSDLYRFTAVGGEILALTIADSGEDLDLRLFDADRNQVDESLGVTTTERVGPVAEAGDYFVRVSTFEQTASAYVLTIGREQAVASADFVPGEVLLGPELANSGPAGDLPAMRTVWRSEVGELARLERPAAHAPGRPAGAPPVSRRRQQQIGTLAAIKQLRTAGRHAWVEPNWIRRPQRTPADRFYPNQWHYRAINLSRAWDLTTGDPGVIVAVLDTGILADHPEFTDPDDPARSQLVTGFDFISDPVNAGDGDGIDPDPNDEGNRDLAGSSSFHGSHVAGTIGARTLQPGAGDGSTGGVAGTAWDVRIMPLRVLGSDGGTTADLIQALLYAGGFDNVSGELPPAPADIVNLSLGSPAASQSEQAAIERLREAGILVVAAAGNDASTAPSYPAAYEGVVSVAATTISDAPAFYSNSGATIDLAAPGGDTSTDINGDGIADGVISATADDSDGDPATPPLPRLGVLAGTSMATPHIAGVMALMKAVHPALTPQEFDALLAAGRLTVDLGAPGRDDRYGHGLIDARKAVVAALELAGGDGEVGPILAATPSGLNFGAFGEVLEFRLGNAGSGALNALPPEVAVPWLSVTAIEVDPATGLGSFRARVNRDLLPGDGVFRTRIGIDSDANSLGMEVQVERSSLDLSADAGYTYLILTDETGSETRFQTSLAVDRGSYPYRFENVTAGRYRLFAGSDSDNDGLICEDGESCGLYPTLDRPVSVEIEGDIQGLDFVTGFPAEVTVNPAMQAGTTAASGEDPEGIRRLGDSGDSGSDPGRNR
jgi:serine protease